MRAQLSFADVASQLEQAFVRMFAPAAAAEIEQGRKAGISRSALSSLYLLSHAELEEGFWEVLTSASFSKQENFFKLKQALGELGNFSSPQLHEDMAFPRARRSKAGNPLPVTRLQKWVVEHPELRYHADMPELEEDLYRLYWAAANPGAVDRIFHVPVINAFSMIRNSASALWTMDLEAFRWPALTPLGEHLARDKGLSALLARGHDEEIWIGLEV